LQDAFETTCLVLFVLLMLLPGFYGVHLYVLMLLAVRRRRSERRRQRAVVRRYQRHTPEHAWPVVTTQIPLYNELPVVRRVLEAVAAMDYPAGRHEIQVLDDSTDGTRAVVDRLCAALRARGHDVKVIRRPERTHYKAGALANGLRTARGELIAVFDADFVPDRGFLRRMVPLLAAQPQVGCVQARWGHLNASESWITESLALGMDGHFGVEQPARAWNGLLLNFNGTAGVWRREAIEDPRVGGWSGDTITEDLDLSYRAQLAGWKIEYRLDEVAPAEVPADANALKAQQRRWATGSIQTARKLLPCVWRSNLSIWQKLEATIHLTQYSVNVWMLLMALYGRTLLWLVPPERYQDFLTISWVLILFAAAAPSISYIYARWAVGGGLAGPMRILRLIALGFGLSVNNTVAVLTGLVQRGGEFVRTPKTGTDGRRPVRRAMYSALRSRLWMAELLIGAFCLYQWLYFLREDHYVGGTFLLLYAIGLLAMGWRSRPETLRRLPAPQPATPQTANISAELATATESPVR